MMTRRDAVASLALFAEFIVSASHADAQTAASAQTPAAAPRPPVFKHDLPGVALDGWEVTVSHVDYAPGRVGPPHQHPGDRKSTRLNSSHLVISYAVFCLKKKINDRYRVRSRRNGTCECFG